MPALRYVRAHPKSVLGQNFTSAHANGWVLVGFQKRPNEEMSYPIFRESLGRWFKRQVLRMSKFDHGLGE